MSGYNPDAAKKPQEVVNTTQQAEESKARFAAAEANRVKALEAAAQAEEAKKYIAEHEVTKGQTLSDIALKHYGHATPPYWKLIFEANKAIIGESEKLIKTGMKLKIPVLPPDLKK